MLSYVWNTTGTTVVSNPGSGPRALALDSSNALYVVEGSKNRVQKYVIGGSSTGTTVAGQTSGTSGSAAAFLDGPSDVAVDSSGNVYVLDQLNNRVQLWNNGSSTGITIAGNGKIHDIALGTMDLNVWFQKNLHCSFSTHHILTLVFLKIFP